MKNPLIFPIAILLAALGVLVATILMTPPIVEKQDPAFDQITAGYSPTPAPLIPSEEEDPSEVAPGEAAPAEIVTPVAPEIVPPVVP
jgi:hypothetical protein